MFNLAVCGQTMQQPPRQMKSGHTNEPPWPRLQLRLIIEMTTWSWGELEELLFIFYYSPPGGCVGAKLDKFVAATAAGRRPEHPRSRVCLLASRPATEL